MAKNKKSLLNESAVRRFMKLAEIDTLSDQFIGQHYIPEQDEEEEVAVDEMPVDDAPVDDAPVDEMPGEEAAEGGEAEITPEAAEAIVDLAAQLEASGAVDAGAEAEVEEVPAEEEMIEEPGARRRVYEEKDDETPVAQQKIQEEDTDELEEQLSGLGIEVVDDTAQQSIKETVYKRVMERLQNEQKKEQREKMVDKLVEGVFARIQKESKK